MRPDVGSPRFVGRSLAVLRAYPEGVAVPSLWGHHGHAHLIKNLGCRRDHRGGAGSVVGTGGGGPAWRHHRVPRARRQRCPWRHRGRPGRQHVVHRVTANKIGRITPTGTITEYPLPTAYSGPGGIAAGPDGNLWFTETFYREPAGSRTRSGGSPRPAPSPNTPCPPLTAAPTGSRPARTATCGSPRPGGNQIGRITPTGTITEYPLPTAGSSPGGIAAGPDGNLWFTEHCGGDRSGGSPPPAPSPNTPCPPPQRSLRDRGRPGRQPVVHRGLRSRIGRITPAGTITEYPLPTADSGPVGIAAGPDGNMWFTEAFGRRIGRITPAGAITEYPLPTVDSYPGGIAAGPDGNMWFTDWEQDRADLPHRHSRAVKRTCPINVTLHKPAPKTVGNRILTDKITTRRPPVSCPSRSCSAGRWPAPPPVRRPSATRRSPSAARSA